MGSVKIQFDACCRCSCGRLTGLEPVQHRLEHVGSGDRSPLPGHTLGGVAGIGTDRVVEAQQAARSL